VPLVANGELNVWLPRYPTNQRLRGEIIYDGPLKAPIRKGDKVARLRVTSTTNAVQEVPLYAAQDVEKAGLVWRGLDSLAHLAFRLIPR
ncbi:MAG: D-alanyl-D-alanine carboxypeptidase, partial [Hyphomicrobiaceae bacterium]